MQQQFTYQSLLETSKRINWRLDDLVGSDKRLDFSKPFLPETFVRAERLAFLSPSERLTLNHIRSRGYLALFELVETFIMPFIDQQADVAAGSDPFRGPALKQFAGEEAKHMELFRRSLAEFDESFGVPCALIGPAHDIADAILGHDPLAVAIATLGLEWMSQGHYVESIKDDRDLDPQFKNLLKHHWMEEAQHAKLDALMLQSMAAARSAEEISRAIDEYFEIGALFDGGFKQQAAFDLDALERARARPFPATQRAEFLEIQHQALRWTFLGSAMRNKNFLAGLASLGEQHRARVEQAAAGLC
ncbi:MAG: hypothetical protein ABUS48_01090 [Pseudomonadota bacterium]